ncbi:carbohydrate esterase family 9 protein [Flagelloscypha sp. PMI_526]|nr:carbohydrate esterase family 9 protein [Flagelloscypha sp. PMI_526]
MTIKQLVQLESALQPRRGSFLFFLIASLVILVSVQLFGSILPANHSKHYQKNRLVALSPAKLGEYTEKCSSIRKTAGPSASFLSESRLASDRFVEGTRPVLLRNAKILTGSRNGSDVVYGDILLDQGLVMGVGRISTPVLDLVKKRDILVLDLGGKSWVTPGLFDLHSHLGVSSAPYLEGSSDTNSYKAPILPWLRSVDGINTHDDAYLLTVSGGVTTAQILPGSANNIGGQAVLMKLRQPNDKSVQSMLLEPPDELFTNVTRHGDYCAVETHEACMWSNPSRVHSMTRMDSAWEFRKAYDEALKIKDAQDAFCDRFERQGGYLLPRDHFPANLQWEALVDVLRGRVKLSVHCYELTNEFEFPVASFHHAGETYLVPDLLKKTWGGTPAAALFASNARKKREAYRNSEFGPAILADNGIKVVMKSDHPVLNSRYLLHEAQLAHYYGLDPALAIASVTSTPADVAGVGWRVGQLKVGYDADLVIWDSHPLSLGSTPSQVFIDGIPQFAGPAQPTAPRWEEEKKKVVEWDGLPSLEGTKWSNVRVKNVKRLWVRKQLGSTQINEALWTEGQNRTVLIQDGRIVCFSADEAECASLNDGASTEVDLHWGLTTFGSSLGMTEIGFEATTNDGKVADPNSAVAADNLPYAIDGLLFRTRDALYAYVRGGVTRAVTIPVSNGFVQGLGTAFRLGSHNALEHGAIIQDVTSLHVHISMQFSVSVSAQFSMLRKRLLNASGEDPWALAVQGTIPLVVEIDSADNIASLLRLKRQVEARSGTPLRLTITSSAEAHLLSKELAEANVSVILSPPLPYPYSWEARRILPGPPLTLKGATQTLIEHGVNVAIGVPRSWEARNTRFILGRIALESNGTLSDDQILALATINLEHALGLELQNPLDAELVLYQAGDMFGFEAKPIGVVNPASRNTELF